MQAELIVDCKNLHGEGAIWQHEKGLLWWVDINGKALWSYDPVSKKSRSHSMPERICCAVPRQDKGWIIAFEQNLVLTDDLESGDFTVIHTYEPNNRGSRFNDGRTDRKGRLIIGGMNEASGAADTSVLRVDADLSVHELIFDVSCSNSTCFSPVGDVMYFTDTPEKTIRAYSYDQDTGSLISMRYLADMSDEPGLPDGSCVDEEGYLWNAEWEGRRVVRIAPDGTIDRIIEVPVWKPTCCTFGGPDLDTLYITTSQLASSREILDREPQSGGLFAVKPGVRGVVDTPFAG
ncbi:SMP-30/gluconolactonase/LRE family protein [uncultured Cohaesibacter sp.]|uniref:SMP-30/gluconolactonase/LRE family protein n=1 Tax=uncultured Cohaesibacter sp. TaxID=1002546 RepID=UPI0029C82756|nr:SMP-30/gluconolactonase/LRE family protein [uncultured Cohaesibacter sp.]